MPVLDHSSEYSSSQEKKNFVNTLCQDFNVLLASVFVTVVETETKHIRGPLT